MQVYILNPEYDIVGAIDDAESVLWQKKYNDVGQCEIYTPCDTSLLELLQRGNYIYRYDDDMCCKIETLEVTTDAEQGDHIIATANDIGRMLSGRIVRWQITFSGTVARFIEKVLTDNVIKPAQTQRAIPNFRIDTSNFAELSDTIEVSAFTDDLLQLIVATCKTYNYGFRVFYDISAREIVFRLYKGKYKASAKTGELVEFSPEYANILSSKYKEDDTEHKNVAYVSYKTSDDESALIKMLSVYVGEAEPTGEERREIFVDGTNIKRTTTVDEILQTFPDAVATTTSNTTAGTSVTNYNARISDDGGLTLVAVVTETYETEGDKAGQIKEQKATWSETAHLWFVRSLGLSTLAKQKKAQVFEGVIDTQAGGYQYKTDFNLGDIVKVANEYGISAEARIVEIMESEDAEKGLEIEPKYEYLS
jgi:hypothetical protein